MNKIEFIEKKTSVEKPEVYVVIDDDKVGSFSTHLFDEEYVFLPYEVWLESSDLRAIADKLDELNNNQTANKGE